VKATFQKLGTCACGAPCSREGGRCRNCFTKRSRERPPELPAKPRKTYSAETKLAALHVVRERSTMAASRQFGIPVATLNDWKYCTQAMAYSPVVQPVSATERRFLLEQLIHEQEIEQRREWRKYRHTRERTGAAILDEALRSNEPTNMTRRDLIAVEVGRGSRSCASAVPRHLIEWLDPVFDEVVEKLAA
jgi:hypothetical protein